MAVALGFEGTESLLRDGAHLAKRISDGEPLSREDWTRALMATEVVFISDVIGSGVDWISTTEYTDAETIQALRTIQHKLVAVVLRPGKTGDVPGWLSR
ncbi:hypothetical protein [Microbacterium sp. GCS4]|uniref:hypothetical protein n=1 Tax=Microbacterium sp. GCS4 TaxID=1692239 RepID=UPI001910EF55|nr:hypothetical protein [Microbacterium sp. GCS4]